jgi:hypothetical protein
MAGIIAGRLLVIGAAMAAIVYGVAACSERVVYLTPMEAKEKEAALIAERRARTDVITRNLPEGCEFRDLGDYSRTKWSQDFPILAIFCGKSVTTDTMLRSGKTSRPLSTTTIGE